MEDKPELISVPNPLWNKNPDKKYFFQGVPGAWDDNKSETENKHYLWQDSVFDVVAMNRIYLTKDKRFPDKRFLDKDDNKKNRLLKT